MTTAVADTVVVDFAGAEAAVTVVLAAFVPETVAATVGIAPLSNLLWLW